MIRATETHDGGVVVEAELVRQPAIYLDQDSLADIARFPPRRDRFLDIWKRKGTLLFSLTNAIDIAGPQDQTKLRIRSFLEALGQYWIPLELNPYKVERKEAGVDASAGTPFVSESFVVSYYPQVHGPTPTLATVVDLIHDERDAVLAHTLRLKEEVGDSLATLRAAYVKDPAQFDLAFPAKPWDPNKPVTFFLRALERLVASEAKSYAWKPNDAIDFMHATVGAGSADFLLLDKQWRRRVLAVAPPRSYPWVFYRHELDAFLDVFENCVIAPRSETT